MVAKRSEYNQLGIGDCGHVVVTWPLRTKLGGGSPRVICDVCTREQYGIDPQEPLWVGLKQKTVVKSAPRKAAPKKPKPKSPWARLMEQEGLF